jgi:hypothetical protein
MFKLVAFCVLAFASAGSVSCKDTTPAGSKCTGACFPATGTIAKGGTLNLGVNGTCTEDITASTYDLKMVFNGLPVLTKKGVNGCIDTKFQLPLNFGSLEVKGAACPVKTGSELTIPAIALVSKSCPNGKLVSTLTAKDGDGNVLFDLEYDITMS